MIEITVVIPVKNEEINIRHCLESVQGFVDIIIVDSGSNDRTLEIAKEYNIKILEFNWNGHFPKKRNWVLRNYKFSTKWVLFLDADEIVTDEFKDACTAAIKDTSVVGYWLRYNNYFQGKLLKHGVPVRKLALFRIGSGEYERIEEKNWCNFDMEIHEHPILSGKTSTINAPLNHNDYKGLYNYLAKHNEYSTWEARRFIDLQGSDFHNLTKRQKQKYRFLDKIWLAPLYFITNYFVRFGFLDGSHGLLLSIFKAIQFFQIRCKIKEIKMTKL